MNGFLRQFEICQRLGVSDQTWMNWRRKGLTPEPVDLPGAKKWREADIEAFERDGIPRERTRHFFTSHRRRA